MRSDYLAYVSNPKRFFLTLLEPYNSVFNFRDKQIYELKGEQLKIHGTWALMGPFLRNLLILGAFWTTKYIATGNPDPNWGYLPLLAVVEGGIEPYAFMALADKMLK